MNAEVVLDTNVLVYAISTAVGEAAKAEVAGRLLAAGNAGISAQILQEFFVTVTRRGPTPLSVAEAIDWLETFEDLPCLPVDASLLVRLVVLLLFQLLRLSLATASRWAPLSLFVFLHCVVALLLTLL